jgi:thiamine-phosphate pyrophosphorylase
MLLPNLTPAVARALEAAQSWAVRLGASEILPEHLLHGLLDEAEGRAAQLLTRAGLDFATFRHEAANRAAPAAPAMPTPLPLAVASIKAIDRARELTGLDSAERTVASEHLLWAVLLEDPPLRRRLEEHGLAAGHLDQALDALQGPPLLPEEPLDLTATIEEMDTARILDASLNRAREALRVIEDYCRFALDDAFLTGECKRLRHGLAEAFAVVPAGALLTARDTLGDVGTAISTAAEGERTSLAGVVLANCKRLQEALRSLEEYGKLQGPELGAAVEGFRYQAYTVERAILLGTTARKRLADARLYLLVTGSLCTAAVDWTVQEALAGGVQVVQLREKSLADRDLLERARLVRRLTRAAGALFVVNDRPDIARLAEADGVHLGQEDMPVREARRVLGPDALIGVSTHDLEQVRAAVRDSASYIGVGPTFPSETKAFTEFPGLEFARRAVAETSLPAFVIGGVHQGNIEQVAAAGLKRVAVSQAVCRADDPCQAAAALRRVLDAV